MIRKRSFCPAFIFFLTVVLLSPFSISAADNGNPVKVNFSDVVKPAEMTATAGNEKNLRIAVAAMISPKYTYTYYVELLNLIGEFMGEPVVFVQKKTYSEVNELLKHKELDLAFVCSGPYAAGKDEFGMEIIAVPVCHGKKVYYSYFIASPKSGITSFEDFRNKTFAFTDPLSNTGYMVPTYFLALRNETPTSFFKKTFFTHSHDNSIQAVADGLADGAAVDSLIYDFMQATNPDLTIKTVIIEKSAPYGIPPVVAPSSLAPERKNKLKAIFLSVHETLRGKNILKKLQIDRFEKGNDADYDSVRQLEAFLKSQRH